MSEVVEGLRVVMDLVKRLVEDSDKGNEPLIVWHIPCEVVKEFDERIVKPYYLHPSGKLDRSSAVKQLILEAIEKEKKRE